MGMIAGALLAVVLVLSCMVSYELGVEAGIHRCTRGSGAPKA